MLESGLSSLVSIPSTLPRCGHVWNQFTIRVPGGRRDEVRQQLAEMNVGSEVYYPVPLHQQECFAYLSDETAPMPETERAASEVLSLPIFPELTEQEQRYVVDCLAKVLGVGQVQLRMVG
jgi:dTDP-4-amino-4,6-dideoxygalactose transaminase